jgi:hypothetical protein
MRGIAQQFCDVPALALGLSLVMPAPLASAVQTNDGAVSRPDNNAAIEPQTRELVQAPSPRAAGFIGELRARARETLLAEDQRKKVDALLSLSAYRVSNDADEAVLRCALRAAVHTIHGDAAERGARGPIAQFVAKKRGEWEPSANRRSVEMGCAFDPCVREALVDFLRGRGDDQSQRYAALAVELQRLSGPDGETASFEHDLSNESRAGLLLSLSGAIKERRWDLETLTGFPEKSALSGVDLLDAVDRERVVSSGFWADVAALDSQEWFGELSDSQRLGLIWGAHQAWDTAPGPRNSSPLALLVEGERSENPIGVSSAGMSPEEWSALTGFLSEPLTPATYEAFFGFLMVSRGEDSGQVLFEPSVDGPRLIDNVTAIARRAPGSRFDNNTILTQLFERLYIPGAITQARAGTCGTVAPLIALCSLDPTRATALVRDLLDGDDDVRLSRGTVITRYDWEEINPLGRADLDALLQTTAMRVIPGMQYDIQSDLREMPYDKKRRGLMLDEVQVVFEELFPTLSFRLVELPPDESMMTVVERERTRNEMLVSLRENPFAIGAAILSWSAPESARDEESEGDEQRNHAVSVVAVTGQQVYFLNSWGERKRGGTVLGDPKRVMESPGLQLFSMDARRFRDLLAGVVVCNSKQVPPRYSPEALLSRMYPGSVSAPISRSSLSIGIKPLAPTKRVRLPY